MGLRERLAGQRVFLTGVTGFVGEALLERMLTDLPETRLCVRPSRTAKHALHMVDKCGTASDRRGWRC